MSEQTYLDFPNVPIGAGNPYSRCVAYGRSMPEINGRLEGHHEWCSWRRSKEAETEHARELADLRQQLTQACERAEKAEAEYKELLDKAGAYCGLRYSLGGAAEATISAYLELRQFIIAQRSA